MKLDKLIDLLKEDISDDAIVLTYKEAQYILRKENGAKFTRVSVRHNKRDVNVAALYVPIPADAFKQKYKISEKRKSVSITDPLTGDTVEYDIPPVDEWGGANPDDAKFFLFLERGEHPDEIKAREKLNGGAE